MNNATATFIKLRLFECHAVPSNTYGQVGIVLVEMFGRPGKANRVKDIVREEYTNEQRQRAKSTVGVGAWQQMEWEERLAVLQNGRKEVEEDTERKQKQHLDLKKTLFDLETKIYLQKVKLILLKLCFDLLAN